MPAFLLVDAHVVDKHFGLTAVLWQRCNVVRMGDSREVTADGKMYPVMIRKVLTESATKGTVSIVYYK